MPYIPQEQRLELQGDYPANSGELNYVITQIVRDYLRCNGENYAGYNDVLGALEGAKLELYRRRIAPYEDRKKEENGDVYV